MVMLDPRLNPVSSMMFEAEVCSFPIPELTLAYLTFSNHVDGLEQSHNLHAITSRGEKAYSEQKEFSKACLSSCAFANF